MADKSKEESRAAEQLERYNKARALAEARAKKFFKPGARLKEPKRFKIKSYDVNGKKMNGIQFKDGSKLLSGEIDILLNINNSGVEPVPGKLQSKTIMRYLDKNNPTKEEFVKHFSSVSLNKGGSVKKNKTVGYNKGGMIDYRKTGLFK